MLCHRSFNWLISKNCDFLAFLLPIGICFLFWNWAQFQVLQSIFKLVTNLRNFCLLRIHKLFLPTLLNWAWKTCFCPERNSFVFAVLHTCKTRVPLIHHFSGTNSTYSKAIRIQSVWTLIFEEQTTYYIHIELPNSSTSHDKKL